MSPTSDWRQQALCLKHENPSLWLSSDIQDMRETVQICQKCPVKMPCLYNAIYEDDFIGVRGGITEYEYLSKTWVEVDDVEQSNWPKSDSIIQRLLREYA